MADERLTRLRDIVAQRSFRRGEFTLASGATSRFYFDLKPTLLDPEGLWLVGRLMIEAVAEDRLDAVGGPAYGAIPIVAAMVIESRAFPRPLSGFYIRKERKERGMERLIDGAVAEGARVAIVEDVTTKGGSALSAVAEARSAGLEVVKVLTVVDRGEGAEAALAASGLTLTPLLTIADFEV